MVREMGTGVSDQIVGHTREALDVVASLMRFADSEPVQLSAAKDLLDRGGFKASGGRGSERLGIARGSQGAEIEVSDISLRPAR